MYKCKYLMLMFIDFVSQYTHLVGPVDVSLLVSCTDILYTTSTSSYLMQSQSYFPPVTRSILAPPILLPLIKICLILLSCQKLQPFSSRVSIRQVGGYIRNQANYNYMHRLNRWKNYFLWAERYFKLINEHGSNK